MTDGPTNDNAAADLRHAVTALATGIAEARRQVGEGKVIDLSGFLSKVSAMCASISANPPADADAPMIMTSIENLVGDLNELGRELSELEAATADAPDPEGSGT
jgi:hypothetical protein